MSREFEDAVQDLQLGLGALEQLFRAATPEHPELAIVHGRIAAAVRQCRTEIEGLLFQVDDLEEVAKIARFERLLAEMPRDRKVRIVERLDRILSAFGKGGAGEFGA